MSATQEEDKKPKDQRAHINLKEQDGKEVFFRNKRSCAGEKAISIEKLCSEAEKEDGDGFIQKKLSIKEIALKSYNNESSPCKKLASGGSNGDETSVAGNHSYEERWHKLKLLASSIEERIIQVQRKVAWLKERRAIKQDGNDVFFRNKRSCAGEKAISIEKLCSEAEKEDGDGFIQKKLSIKEIALKSYNNESSPYKKLASGGSNGDETSVAGNHSYEKRWQKLKLLASSIEERIIEVQRKVAWLKERRAIKQRKIVASCLI